MDLSDKLVSTAQRDKSGADSLDRYDFQACWGLSHLLDLHQSGADYAVGFEFHDDILVIDSATSPTHVRFFQVKTKKAGLCAMTDLVSRPGKSKKASIVGKMLANKLKFPDETDHLGFVSNAQADFLTSPCPCGFTTAKKESFKQFVDALKDEFPGIAADEEAKLFHYHVSDFSLEKYKDGIRGRLGGFILACCGKFELGQESLLLSLLDQCIERSKHVEDAASFEELLKSKFLTREKVNDYLQDFVVENKRRPSWDGAQTWLAGCKPARVRAIHSQWSAYEADLFRVSDMQVRTVRDTARRAVDAYLIANPEAEFLALLEDVVGALRPIAAEKVPHRNDDYLRAVVLWEFNCVET